MNEGSEGMGVIENNRCHTGNKIFDVITSNAQKILNLLYRTCKDVNDVEIKKCFILTWVRSRLEYASVVRSPFIY